VIKAKRKDGRETRKREDAAPLRLVPAQPAPERYSSRKELLAAVEGARCIEDLGGERITSHLVDEMRGLRAMADDAAGRECLGRLSQALHDARALLSLEIEGRREATCYSKGLRRIVDAVIHAVALPPPWRAAEDGRASSYARRSARYAASEPLHEPANRLLLPPRRQRSLVGHETMCSCEADWRS
jgi:hypothetical protein